MKIIKLQANNVKRLKAVEITPTGHVVQITGANGAGKSSILDSIFYALAGTKEIPSHPIRNGQERASITLDLGEVVVTRQFTASGSTLKVEAASGARFPTPQKMLDEICGKLSFDPLAFTRLAPKLQLETLKKLVTLEVDVDALDGLNQRDYEKRTEVGREVVRLKGQLAGLVIPDVAKEDLELDESAILKEMEEAATHNRVIDGQKSFRAAQIKDVENLTTEITAVEERLAALKAKRQGILDALYAAPAFMEAIDIAQVRGKAERARVAGNARRALAARDQLTTELRKQVDLSDTLTITMSDRLSQKTAAIANAEMPVKGLTFGEGEVVFNGVPFDQASQAEQLMVSTVIAMALNPRLRVIRIQDGSLLDAHNLELLAKLAEKGDYQIWLETVSSTDPSAIQIEDGEVVGQSAGAPPVEVASA